jgi:hypothetical protein
MICPKTSWQIHNMTLLTPIMEHTTITKGVMTKKLIGLSLELRKFQQCAPTWARILIFIYSNASSNFFFPLE